MRTFNIITNKGTWQIKGVNLYEACKCSDLRLAARYPGIRVIGVMENKPFVLPPDCVEIFNKPYPVQWN